MDIADIDAHAALTYVAAMNRQGYQLLREEFDAYAGARARRGSVPKSLLDLLKPVPSFTSPPESVAAWLIRLGWIKTDDDGHVVITKLGEAVLRELD